MGLQRKTATVNEGPTEQSLNPTLFPSRCTSVPESGDTKILVKRGSGEGKDIHLLSLGPESRYEEAQGEMEIARRTKVLVIFHEELICLYLLCQQYKLSGRIMPADTNSMCRQHLPLSQWFRTHLPHSCISNHKNRRLDPGLPRDQCHQERNASTCTKEVISHVLL